MIPGEDETLEGIVSGGAPQGKPPRSAVVGRMGAKAGATLGEKVLRPFTYAVVGNLSGNIQELTERVTKGWYHAVDATHFSLTSNILTYVITGAAIAYAILARDGQPEAALSMLVCGTGGIVGFLYGAIEGLFRGEFSSGISSTYPVASLPGLLVLLPLQVPLLIGKGIAAGYRRLRASYAKTEVEIASERETAFPAHVSESRPAPLSVPDVWAEPVMRTPAWGVQGDVWNAEEKDHA